METPHRGYGRRAVFGSRRVRTLGARVSRSRTLRDRWRAWGQHVGAGGPLPTCETIEDPPANTGHLHVFLNGQEVAQSDQEVVRVDDVADQEYQLSVALAAADHRALDPYVGTTIYVTVDHTVCEEGT